LIAIFFSCLSYYLLRGDLVLGNGLLLIFLGIVFFMERESILKLRKSTE